MISVLLGKTRMKQVTPGHLSPKPITASVSPLSHGGVTSRHLYLPVAQGQTWLGTRRQRDRHAAGRPSRVQTPPGSTGETGSPTCSREDAAVRSGNRTRGQRALRVRSPKVSGGEGTQTDC